MARLSGIFAYSALRSGDRLSFLRYSDHIEKFLPPKKRTKACLGYHQRVLIIREKEEVQKRYRCRSYSPAST